MAQTAGYFQWYATGDQGSLITGCDISSYQLPVNFGTMYSAGARFCYIKAGGNLATSIDTIRYVKVTVNGNDEDNIAQFNLLEVMDTSIVDRASGITPTASSVPTSGALANITDGSESTFARFTTGEQWIKVDLSTTYNIRYFRLKMKSTVTYNNLKIEVSTDDISYTTVYDSTQSGTGNYEDKTTGMIVIGATGTYSQNSACDSTVISDARSAGLSVGFYWFHNPNYYKTSTLEWTNTTTIAEYEAGLFKTYIDNELGGNDYGDIMPMLDWENNYGSIYPASTNDGAYEFINAFINKFRELTGRQIILYSAYYTNETLSTTGNQLVHSVNGGIGKKCPLWLSAMYGAGTYPSYNYTAFGDFYNDYWRIWQYSTDGNGLGATYGVSSSDVDLNFVESLEYITDTHEFPYFTYRTRDNTTDGVWNFEGSLQRDSVDVVTDDRTINGTDLTSNITLTQDDIGDGVTYVQTTNDYTDAEKTKLSGITEGADLTSDANETITGDWNHTGTLQQGGNDVLTTASIIADIHSIDTQTDEIELTNAIDGVLDVKSVNGVSAFQQNTNGNFEDTTGWSGSQITLGASDNTLTITTSTTLSAHYAEKNIVTIDGELITGRTYFIIGEATEINGCRLLPAILNRISSGSYVNSYADYLETAGMFYAKLEITSQYATPDSRFRMFIQDLSGNSTWTPNGAEYAKIKNLRLIDLTACGLNSLSNIEIYNIFKNTDYWLGRNHAQDFTIISTDSSKTEVDSITSNSLNITTLKSLSATVYDSYDEDSNVVTKRIGTSTGNAADVTVNTTSCPGMKASTGIYFAYNSEGEYQSGTIGDTLAFANADVIIDYELATATETSAYGCNLVCAEDGYIQMESVNPYPKLTVDYPRNLAGVVNTNSYAIEANDNNIQLLSNQITTRKLVTKSDTGDEYLRLARIKMTGASAYARVFYKIDIAHTGTYVKTGTILLYFYKVNGYGTLHANSYAWAINNTGSASSFASGDLIYQNWQPASGVIGYVDVYILVKEYAKIYYTLQQNFSENNATGGVNEFILLPTGDTLLSAVPATSATMTLDGITYTADAAVNATIKTVTMT